MKTVLRNKFISFCDLIRIYLSFKKYVHVHKKKFNRSIIIPFTRQRYYSY